MVTDYPVLPIPRQVPPRLVVNQNEQDTNDERELPLLLLKKMADHAFMQVISNLPLRMGGTFIANYACRRLNRILATTARLVPVAYNHPTLSHIPLYITAHWPYPRKNDIGVPWAYDPTSNGWYKFPLNRSLSRRDWIWDKIASADGLVCAPSRSNSRRNSYELEIFDPYTQRFRTLPSTPVVWPTGLGEYVLAGYSANFSTNIWIIDPATCEYKVIVMTCMYHIARASRHLLVESYDRTHNWQVLLRSYNALPPGLETIGTSAICHDTLYMVFRNTSLNTEDSETVGQELYFLHRFDLKSTNTRFKENLYPLPGPFGLRSPVILNCNNNLILVGGKENESGGCSVKVWSFTPEPARWRRLGVMPYRFLRMLCKPMPFQNLHRYTGAGNFVYFRNSHGNRLVVLNLSMTDERGLRLRNEAWTEASECPIGDDIGAGDPDKFRGNHKFRYDFCYEPRLLMGVPL
ncbi:hypothetical protein O6H91_06G031200 [Diphasiastrum complanatum]|uniref:Uncharacterized protein n=1 Tax=Diphasiastrum complanatum TaxID=34168 RepID=A0ACC2DC21_DIPCM|nr:hypothetical protein O6H91_06G031200 [Diphasiastrum complanatum]